MPPAPESLTQRILGRRAGASVRPGDVVTVEVDRIMAHDGTGPVVAATLERHGIEELRGAARMVIVFDHYYPPVNEREAHLQSLARRFAARYGIPVLAGEGISHQVLPEKGLIGPGQIVVGADSHTCTGGAFGALAIGLGATDVAGVLASGQLWLEVPETVFVRLSGTLPPGSSGQDLALTVVAKVGASGALGQALEFIGPGLEGLSMPDRMKLANHAVEMGAVAGVIGADARCLSWLAERGADLTAAQWGAPTDSDAAGDVEIDLGEVEPSVALPSRPDQVVKRRDVEAVSVDQVFIGSCAGGRAEDLREAAEALAGRRVNAGTRLYVGPASREVLEEIVADGTLSRLLAAGAVLLPTGCGACLGRLGTLDENEVAVATQNRNFTGRMGHPSSRLFLVSPATAAEVAVTGRLEPEAT